MNTLSKLVLAAGISLFVAGCATTGPKYSEVRSTVSTLAEGNGRIYFYRTMLLGMAVQPEVKIDGEVVGRAVPNGFFYVDRTPGAHEVTTTTEVERKLSLTLDRNQTRYVRLNLSIGFFVGHVYPELVDNDAAEKEMQSLSYTGK